MVLSNYKVGAGFAVSDMARAREFYEGKLGLSVSIDSPNNVQYRCAEDSVLHIYLSPEHVGKSTETLASWASTTSRGSWASSPRGASPSSSTTNLG